LYTIQQNLAINVEFSVSPEVSRKSKHVMFTLSINLGKCGCRGKKNNWRTLKIPFTFLLKLYRQADFVEYLLTFVAITNRHAKKSNPKNQKSIGNK